MWKSKTIAACITAIAASVMALVGHYTGGEVLPDGAILSAYSSAVAAVFAIVFRVMAKERVRITVRRKTKDGDEVIIMDIDETEEDDDEPES